MGYTLWPRSIGFWTDTTRIGQRISGVGAVMMLAIALSNLHIIPMSAPSYDTIFTYLVPAAIPLLLFKANLRRIIPETGGMLLAYLLDSKLFKLDLAEVIIASNAISSGPSTAAALAASKGWYELVTPGVLCGTLGYVIASFLGVFIAGLLG